MPYSEDVPAGGIGELHSCDRLAGLLCGGLAFTVCREGYGLLAWVLLMLMAGGLFLRKEGRKLRAERGGVGRSLRGLAEALNSAPACLCFFNRNTWDFKRRPTRAMQKAARDKPSPPLKARIK